MKKKKGKKLPDNVYAAVRSIMQCNNIIFKLALNVYNHKYSLDVAIEKQQKKNRHKKQSSQDIWDRFTRLGGSFQSRC